MPRYFSKQMQSPYFNSPRYAETKEAQMEAKIEKAFTSLINRFKFWRGPK